MNDLTIRKQIHKAADAYGSCLTVHTDLAAQICQSEKRVPRTADAHRILKASVLIVLILLFGGTSLAVGSSLGKVNFMEGAVFRFFQEHHFPSFRSIVFFNWLIEATIFGSLLILLFLLVRPLVRRLGGYRAVCLLWILVAARLLIPIVLPNPLMSQFTPTHFADAAARPIVGQLREHLSDVCMDARWAYEQRMSPPYAPSVPQTLPGNADREQVFWNAIGEFGLATSYGWTGTWVLICWASVAGLTMATFVFLQIRKRKREGIEIGYLLIWTLVRHVCTALQWFNPFVWLSSHLAGMDMEKALSEDMSETSKGKRIACTIIAGMIVLATFCTAEYKGMDMRSGEMMVNEHEETDPFDAWDRAWYSACTYSLVSLDTPEMALAHAQRLRNTQLFCDDPEAESVAVKQAADCWIIETGEASYTFNQRGALIAFSRLSPTEELKPTRAQLSETIQRYAEKYAKTLMNMAGEYEEVGELIAEQTLTDGISTYIPVRLVMDKKECYIVFRMNEKMQIEKFDTVYRSESLFTNQE